MKIIAVRLKPEDAHLVRALLEGNGIPAFLRDEFTITMDPLRALAIGGVKVEVADEDEVRARDVLAHAGEA